MLKKNSKLTQKRWETYLIWVFILLFFFINYNISENNNNDDYDEKYNYKKFTISGNSMFPTLTNNDVVISKMSSENYTINYEHGDIVIFKLKLRDETFVKRIIAVQGDEVLFKTDGFIYLNGEKLNEKYVRDKSFEKNKIVLILKQLEHYKYIIPKNYVLVFGDNRENSLDSSTYGLISVQILKGKIVKY
jgi:signal peptidase I